MKTKLACAAIGVAAVLVSACSSGNGMLQGNVGQVRFVMSGATAPTTASSSEAGLSLVASSGASSLLLPANGGGDLPQPKAVNVTLTSIVARSLDGKLVEVAAAFPFTVDLAQIGEGHEVTLPVGSLPPGTYDQLVVVISNVEIVKADDSAITLTPPGGGWTSIVRVTEPFTVVDGQMTTVHLRLRMRAVLRWLDDHFEFHPEFECDGD